MLGTRGESVGEEGYLQKMRESALKATAKVEYVFLAVRCARDFA